MLTSESEDTLVSWLVESTLRSELTRRQEEQVLWERGEQMPDFEVDERADDVETVGGRERDCDVDESFVAEQTRKDQELISAYTLKRACGYPPLDVFPSSQRMRYRKVDGETSAPKRDSRRRRYSEPGKRGGFAKSLLTCCRYRTPR